jgi:hypothetical protein
MSRPRSPRSSPFSFKNNNITATKIGDNLYLRLERSGQAIARIYFVNEGSAEVPVPEGLVVQDVTNNVVVEPFLGNNYFVVAWNDDYTISLNGILIVGLANQRQWSVSGPRGSGFVTIQP